jgi:hypothetical protein
VLAFGLYLRDSGTTGVPQAQIPDRAKPALPERDVRRVKAEPAPSELPVPGNDPLRAPTADQLAQEVLDQSIIKTIQSFRADLQAFVREAELLPAQDHEPRARELLAEVDVFSTAGYVTGPEALALRLSLLRYALPADDYLAAADTLVSDARQRAEHAEREWATRHDPKLERYRAEERRIVDESATMDEFPDGMTRQAYLREKLLELRSEIFRNNEKPVE